VTTAAANKLGWQSWWSLAKKHSSINKQWQAICMPYFEGILFTPLGTHLSKQSKTKQKDEISI